MSEFSLGSGAFGPVVDSPQAEVALAKRAREIRSAVLSTEEEDSVLHLLKPGLMRAGRSRIIKRSLDIGFSVLALCALAPFLISIAIAIRLTSPGPALFVQPRYGKNGKPFNILKFRTLRSDLSDVAGTKQAVANDPRLTLLGALLRRYSIDELPQLFNVIKGDMSLVGPRPHAIGMMSAGMLYEELVPAYHLRHLVKPGLTGLAQANGYRGPTFDPLAAQMRIVCDLTYICEFSIYLDLKVLIRTLFLELRRPLGT